MNKKGTAVGLVVCFVAMIAIVGMITFSQYQTKVENEKQQLAKAEKTEEEPKEEQAHVSNTENIQAEIPNMIEMDVPNAVVVEQPKTNTLTFSASDELSWPVEGNVVLSYSMDQTVYFSTLDQYKYNPAIIIGSEIGKDVVAAATGTISKIEVDAQTGTTITMDLGSGYEAIYGQLKEVCVKEGDTISQGELLGYVSEPTKYYSVEGPNLYFQLLKKGEPVNPMEYLEA